MSTWQIKSHPLTCDVGVQQTLGAQILRQRESQLVCGYPSQKVFVGVAHLLLPLAALTATCCIFAQKSDANTLPPEISRQRIRENSYSLIFLFTSTSTPTRDNSEQQVATRDVQQK